jgi:archaeal flagellar protein FlaJ
MRQISKKTRQMTVAVSSVLVILVVAVLAFTDFNALTSFANEIFLAALFIITVPVAVMDFENQRWMSAIEDQMPQLVRGISESQETGLTLIKSLEKIVENKMIGHPLSDEVKKLTVQMAWGTSFEQALINFKNRINSPIVNRFCALVLEASRSGGTIKKVFTETSGFMEEMKDMDKETSAQMKPYIIVIYTAFAIFLVVAILLVQSFFAPVQGQQQILGQGSVGSIGGLKDFFYKDMIVSAVTGGLVAGKLAERRVAAGLKHAIILGVVGYVIFFISIPPTWM